MVATGALTTHTPAVVLDRDTRRELVGALTRAHLTQREIGARVGVSHETVRKDQGVIRRYWRAKAMAHFDDYVAEELAKYDAAERQILMRPWVVFDEDKTPHIIDVPDDQVRPLSNEDIDQLLKISDRRRKLLGLDMPSRSETVNVNIDAGSADDRLASVLDALERKRQLHAQADERKEVIDV